MELIPIGDGWYTQKLSCGNTGKIRIMDPIEERIENSDKVKSTAIKFKPYGQIHRTGPKYTRNIPCKDCGHNGTKHRFTPGYTGNHNCYLCKCPNYRPA